MSEKLTEEELARLEKWAKTHEPAGLAIGRFAAFIAEACAATAQHEADIAEQERRVREGRQLLMRMVKYAREDRAVTPGKTRLARLTDSVDDYLRRTFRASDCLRGDPEPTAAKGE